MISAASCSRQRSLTPDMDGTLLNTEDLYTKAANLLLAKYGKGPLTWDVKVNLQGRPATESAKIMISTYELPLTVEQYQEQNIEIQKPLWQELRFLPGAHELLQYMKKQQIPIGLATSSHSRAFDLKTGHLKDAFAVFEGHIVTGNDARIAPGRGKPHPDIWLACLASINDARAADGFDAIDIEECLIFEDGIPGVVSGHAANAHVIWIPDRQAVAVLNGKENTIIGGKGEILESLLDFDPAKYGF